MVSQLLDIWSKQKKTVARHRARMGKIDRHKDWLEEMVWKEKEDVHEKN